MNDGDFQEVSDIVTELDRREIRLVHEQLVMMAKIGHRSVSVADLRFQPAREGVIMDWLRATYLCREPWLGSMVVHLARRPEEES